MRVAIKLGLSVVFILIIVTVVLRLYVAGVAGVDIPGLTGAFRTDEDPISAEAIARGRAVEGKIQDAVEDKSAFFLELTNRELTNLLLSRMDPTTPIRDAEVSIKPGKVDLSGSLDGRVGIPFSGSVDVSLEAGEIKVDVRSIKMGFIPLPGAVGDELQPLIDEVLDINESITQAGATQIQSLLMEEGEVTIIGVQQGGQTVSDQTKETFLQAFATAGREPPVPPAADVVPPGRTAGEPGPNMYLALGDSLAANVGAAFPEEGYVSRFHSYVERQKGITLGLMNLGVSGESSISVVKSQLPTALDVIRERRDGGDPDTTVSVVSLDLGSNDLLSHLGSADCQSAPTGTACQARAEGALEVFAANFEAIVSSLEEALGPDADFYIMTAYNPFDFGIGLPFESFSNSVVERLNRIIRETAITHGALLADPFPLMNGNAGAWTHMLDGDIHPNGDGYQVLAFSLVQAQ